MSGADTGKVGVRVITRRRLAEFWEKHPDAEEPLKAWFRIMEGRRFRTPHEVREVFGSVDFLRGYRTVFDIGGNKYRLVVDMRYDLGHGRVYIRHVLTHEEYDRLSKRGQL